MILETALMCMAFNIYHEANNQSMLGQIAVGQVVMNRVEDSRFPDTVCEVVKQAVTYKGTDKPVLHKCQFSWYCDGKKDEPNYDSKAWSKALKYAVVVLGGNITLDLQRVRLIIMPLMCVQRGARLRPRRRGLTDIYFIGGRNEQRV